MARVIQDEIKQVLADHLLFGDLTDGGHVKIDVEDDKLVCHVKSTDNEALNAWTNKRDFYLSRNVILPLDRS